MPSDQVVLAILGTLGVVLSGAGAKRFVDRWFAQQRERLKLSDAAAKDGLAAAGEKRRLLAADNEQRASMLHDMVDERDRELKDIRARELKRESEIGDIRAQLARLEERSSSQANQIAVLQSEVARWDHDYQEMRRERDSMKAERDAMKAERDAERDGKHAADNKLTPLLMRATMAESSLATANTEIERLKGQIDALAKRNDATTPRPASPNS